MNIGIVGDDCDIEDKCIKKNPCKEGSYRYKSKLFIISNKSLYLRQYLYSGR